MKQLELFIVPGAHTPMERSNEMKSQNDINSQSRKRVGMRSAFGRLARSGAVLGAAAALLAGALGCSGAEGSDAAEVDTISQDLREGAWKPWFTGLFGSTDLNSDVALCNVRNNLAYFLVAQTTSSQYQIRSFGRIANPSWAAAGSRAFNSAPTCTPERFPGTTDGRFLIAGRGALDGRIYVAQGLQGATPSTGVPPNPTFTVPNTQINATSFTGTNGHPALATNNSRVVLAFKNGSRVSAHQQLLPYSASNWGAAINSPFFPAGVTVTGVPAITFISGSTNKFIVMVRGTSSGVAGLYWILFTGTAFEGTSWNQAFTGGVTVSSDPALEYDRDFGALTLYFRSGNDVLQTSVSQPGEFGVKTYVPIPNLANAVLRGAPRAAWPAGIEGIRTVIIRGFNDNVSSNLNRHILSAETIGVQDPFEFP
jgi:hypothetical protein